MKELNVPNLTLMALVASCFIQIGAQLTLLFAFIRPVTALKVASVSSSHTALWNLDAAAKHAVNTRLGIDRIEGAILDGRN